MERNETDDMNGTDYELLFSLYYIKYRATHYV